MACDPYRKQFFTPLLAYAPAARLMNDSVQMKFICYVMYSGSMFNTADRGLFPTATKPEDHGECVMSSAKSRKEIWEEWNKLVNMSPSKLEDWLQTDESKSVGDSDKEESTGHKSGRQILQIKRTKKAALTNDQWDHMANVVGYIKRHRAQGGPKEDVESSAWRYSLMNWGHDPLDVDGND